MPAYVVLVNYTQQGIAKMKESPARLDSVRKLAKEKGGKLKDFYLTLGRYDAVAVFEAPDDETMAEVMLSVGAQGNVRTETLRAFTEEEYRKIAGALA